MEWLERNDLANLWDGVHFIGAFQFIAGAVKGDISPNTTGDTEGSAGLEAESASDMESRLKEAFLKNADNNSKVAVGWIASVSIYGLSRCDSNSSSRYSERLALAS